MKSRRMRDRVFWMGAVDWNRRLFDALIPLPDGTSYNAYLVRGTDKTALLDTVDPGFWEVLKAQLEKQERDEQIVKAATSSTTTAGAKRVLASSSNG